MKIKLLKTISLLIGLLLSGCATSPYAKMAPNMKRGGLLDAWPAPTGTYTHPHSTGASGNITITEVGRGVNTGRPVYTMTGRISFDYQQSQDPTSKDFDPAYPTKNRIWGYIDVKGVYCQVGPNMYLDCEGVVNGEAALGTFDNWMDRGVSKGSRQFTIHFNQAIATASPMEHPPVVAILGYKNDQIVSLARLTK